MNQNENKNDYDKELSEQFLLYDTTFREYWKKVKKGFLFYGPDINDEMVSIFVKRLVAFMIDLIIFLVLLTISFSTFIFLTISSFENADISKYILSNLLIFIIFLICTFIPFLYYLIMDSYMKGTIGKKIMGLELVDFQGNAIGFRKNCIRMFVKWIVNYFTFGIAQICSIASKRNQTFYDIFALCIVRQKQK